MKLLFLLLIVLVSLLTYSFGWFNLLLAGLLILSCLFLALVGVSFLFFKRIQKWLYRVPVILIAVCLFGIVLSLFLPYDPAISSSGDMSKDLEYTYNTDQSDRKNLKSYIAPFKNSLQRRDSIRLAQVRMLYEQNLLQKPMDKFHAAFVYHHGNSKENYEIATLLAGQAADAEELKNHYQVQWLAKASYDRWMIFLGRPQRYNTQQNFSIELE